MQAKYVTVHRVSKIPGEEVRSQNPEFRMKREKAKEIQDWIVCQKAHQSGEISKLLEAYSNCPLPTVPCTL
ncbi:MAG TPA: hypothetical protein ENH52_02910 [Nitrospirae bacterium]|nr:hypothetical protein [Nitrospirota bacterium]